MTWLGWGHFPQGFRVFVGSSNKNISNLHCEKRYLQNRCVWWTLREKSRLLNDKVKVGVGVTRVHFDCSDCMHSQVRNNKETEKNHMPWFGWPHIAKIVGQTSGKVYPFFWISTRNNHCPSTCLAMRNSFRPVITRLPTDDELRIVPLKGVVLIYETHFNSSISGLGSIRVSRENKEVDISWKNCKWRNRGTETCSEQPESSKI